MRRSIFAAIKRYTLKSESASRIILLDDVANSLVFGQSKNERVYIFRIKHVRRTSQIWPGSPSQKYRFWTLFILFPACFFTANCARSLDPVKVVEARRLLNDKELDSVTAGAVSIDVELSAAAEGTNAVTSTQGSIATARGTVLRIAVDPSAPEPARARLLGVSTADFALGIGKANAEGTSNVGCSASVIAVGDVTYIAQSRIATAISATCSCSALGIGIVTQ